jgi:glutathione S-transferase
MSITLYGIAASRASRCLWALEETGLPYQHVKTVMRKDTGTPEFLKVNPNGRIPVLVDGEVTVFESLAINSYIASKAGGDLAPKDLAESAALMQWSLWVMTEAEKALLDAMFHTLGIMGREKDPDKVAEAVSILERPFKVLNQELDKKNWLVGDRFSMVDLNVASVLSWAKTARLDLSAFPNIARWLAACLERPAFGRVREMQKAG